jgi:hypothetical protein
MMTFFSGMTTAHYRWAGAGAAAPIRRFLKQSSGMNRLKGDQASRRTRWGELRPEGFVRLRDAVLILAVLAATGGMVTDVGWAASTVRAAGAQAVAPRTAAHRAGEASAHVASQASGAAAASPAPFPDATFASDTRTYLRRIEKLGFSGVVAVDARDGRLLAEGLGLADREAGARWRPTTVSTIGSITKQFTAALVLRLEEEGLLSVQDPIGRHLDGVPPDKQGVTLHHLLTHTSGIEDLEGADDWDPIGREEFVRRALAAPLSARPGERYSYSNAGYSLLGAIVERRTGRSYEQARVFVWESAEPGRLLGIGMRRFEPAALLFPIGGSRFASFDSVTGRTVPARFEAQTDGLMRLTLGGPGSETVATRR